MTIPHPGLKNTVYQKSEAVVEIGVISAVDEALKTVQVVLIDSGQVIDDVPVAQPYYNKGTGTNMLPELNAVALVWWLSHGRPFIYGFLPLVAYSAQAKPDYSGRVGGSMVTADHVQGGEQETVGPLQQYIRMDKDGNVALSDGSLDTITLIRTLGLMKSEMTRFEERTELGTIFRGVFFNYDDKKGFVEAKDDKVYYPASVERFYKTADAKLDNYDSDEALIRAVLDQTVVVEKKKRHPVVTRFLSNVINRVTLKRRVNAATKKPLIERTAYRDEAKGTLVGLDDLDEEGGRYVHIAGPLDLTVDGDKRIRALKDVKIHVSGVLHIKVDGVCAVDAEKILLNCDVAKPIPELPIPREKLDIEQIGEDDQMKLGEVK